jgi:hypothetical protein
MKSKAVEKCEKAQLNRTIAESWTGMEEQKMNVAEISTREGSLED